MNRTYDIILEEFEEIHPKIKEGLVISKSVNAGSVEINYENTWKGNDMGLPIFPMEDFYAGSELLMACIARMGVIPTVTYDANIFISLGMGTRDKHGNLIEENMRYSVKAVAKSLEIIGKYSGFID
jgi:hypothetical protein